MKKYYYAGTTRVAVRTGTANPKWLLSDHLGSQAITASYDGLTEEGEVRYKAWGEDRYTSGTTPTSYRYTGQRSRDGDASAYTFMGHDFTTRFCPDSPQPTASSPMRVTYKPGTVMPTRTTTRSGI